MNEPKHWTAEIPNLYRIVVSLIDENGNAVDVEAYNVGFRNIEMKNGQLLVNGKAVLIRGVNRHEHHQTKGHAINEDDMLEDIKLLKQNNFNAVRTAHYPNHPRWYEHTATGFMVDEANIETHGMFPMGRLSRDRYGRLHGALHANGRARPLPTSLFGVRRVVMTYHDAMYGWAKSFDHRALPVRRRRR